MVSIFARGGCYVLTQILRSFIGKTDLKQDYVSQKYRSADCSWNYQTTTVSRARHVVWNEQRVSTDCYLISAFQKFHVLCLRTNQVSCERKCSSSIYETNISHIKLIFIRESLVSCVKYLIHILRIHMWIFERCCFTCDWGISWVKIIRFRTSNDYFIRGNDPVRAFFTCEITQEIFVRDTTPWISMKDSDHRVYIESPAFMIKMSLCVLSWSRTDLTNENLLNWSFKHMTSMQYIEKN